MIKAKINNLSQPTDVWLWLNAKETNTSNIYLLLTFHATKEGSKKEQEKNTDKYLQTVSKIPSEILIPMPATFTNLEGLRIKISEEAVKYINSLALPNITSLTIEL